MNNKQLTPKELAEKARVGICDKCGLGISGEDSIPFMERLGKQYVHIKCPRKRKGEGGKDARTIRSTS